MRDRGRGSEMQEASLLSPLKSRRILSNFARSHIEKIVSDGIVVTFKKVMICMKPLPSLYLSQISAGGVDGSSSHCYTTKIRKGINKVKMLGDHAVPKFRKSETCT